MNTQMLVRGALIGVAFSTLAACADAGDARESGDPSADGPAEIGASDDELAQTEQATLDEVSRLLAGDGREFEVDTDLELDPTALPSIPTEAAAGAGADLGRNGPHRVGSYRRGFRDGPDFRAATIFFPTDEEDDLSGVVMCPGFTGVQSSLAAWGPFFASHGIVLMTIDTNSPLDPVPTRSRALLDALASLTAENERAESPLRGRLSADKFGLAGHSMGGGGTWIASAAHPELKSAVTLAGHNLSAGGARIARGSQVPTLMMNGALDITILGGLGQSSGAFEEIPDTTPKLLYEMRGVGHFAWGTPRTNGGASGRYMMAWQKVFLEGEVAFEEVLRTRGPNAAVFRSNLE